MCFNFQVVVEQQEEAEAVLHHPVVHQLPQLKQRLEEHEAERHLQSPLEQQQEVVREEVVQQLPEEPQVLCWLSWLGSWQNVASVLHLGMVRPLFPLG